jgi:tellurite resistance-related uncharacterized protein
MKQLPEDVRAYRRTASFTEATVPKGLLSSHRTASGVWAKIHVEKGELVYTIGGESYRLKPGLPGIVEPEVKHFVTPEGQVEFFVEFYKTPEQA